MFQLTIGQKAPEPFDWILKLAELVRAFSWLAWPVVVIILAWIFRNSIRGFIGKVQTAEGLGFKASAGQQIEEVETKVERAIEADREATPSPKMAYDEAPPQLLVQGVDPFATVLKAWSSVEEALSRLADQGDRSKPLSALIKGLETTGFLTGDDREALFALRTVRNLVAHSPNDFKFAPDQAEKYAQAAGKMTMRIRMLARSETRRIQ